MFLQYCLVGHEIWVVLRGTAYFSLTKIKQLWLMMKHRCTMKPANSGALMRADTQQHPGRREGRRKQLCK